MKTITNYIDEAFRLNRKSHMFGNFPKPHTNWTPEEFTHIQVNYYYIKAKYMLSGKPFVVYYFIISWDEVIPREELDTLLTDVINIELDKIENKGDYYKEYTNVFLDELFQDAEGINNVNSGRMRYGIEIFDTRINKPMYTF